MLKYEGGQYSVTEDDKLWLLRAVEVEGSPQEKVAQALCNGFCYVRAKSPAWKTKTLTDFVRAYAQPVNPRWFDNGDLLLASIKSEPPTSPKRAAEMKKGVSRRTVHSVRTTFKPSTVAAVDKALNGRVISDVTDYAAPHIDGARKGMVARTEAKQGENRFWTRNAGWKGYLADAGTAAKVAGGAGVAIALLAFAGWYLLKRGA